MSHAIRMAVAIVALISVPLKTVAGPLRAGVGKVEITDRAAGPVHDPSFVRALVVKDDKSVAVIIAVDVVAVAEIGRLRNGYLESVRGRLERELGIAPGNVIVNASHCHSIVRADTDALTVEAVKKAWNGLVPVTVGCGSASETRISENRRLKLKDGSETDMRRSYSMPRDEDVAAVGPIDPQVGLFRLDREDGTPLGLVYNFACHPILNPPRVGNTADFSGYASSVIEECLGDGAVALFLQGCGGDINPIGYKDVYRPPSAETLGIMLGLTAFRAAKTIATKSDAELRVIHETLSLPRGADFERRIAAIEAERIRTMDSLKPTDINFKTFVPLYLQQKISSDFPGYYSQGYLHEKSQGRTELAGLDATNRASVEAYVANINAMERLTRLNVNHALLKKHLAQTQAAGKPTLDVETTGLRIGDFRLITFPGELTVEVGLAIKSSAAKPNTFVAGYTNGYIYYLPTESQRNNVGYAQEDCDTLVAPEWRKSFETKALEILGKL